MRYLALFTLVAMTGLTGCFGDSSEQAAAPQSPAQPDSFVVEVQRQVNLSELTADSLEAIQVAQLMETTPETDEPIALVF